MKDMTFAEWLTTTREEQGYSKNALANRSGVNRTHLYKMESGEIAEPAEDTRQRLHAVFGTSDADLVELGILEGKTYQRANGPVTHYEYVKRPLIPPMQQPTPSQNGADPMLAEVLRIWPGLPEPERRHLVETAQMAERAVTQERTHDAPDQATPSSPESPTRHPS